MVSRRMCACAARVVTVQASDGVVKSVCTYLRARKCADFILGKDAGEGDT